MKWDEDTIKKRILQLHEAGEELTNSRVKEIDSKLVGAAISFYGNWGDAVRAAGLDYDEIRRESRRQRSEKVRKWTSERVIDEIKAVAEKEGDISYAFMKEKHSALVAAACNYVGSWKQALELAGFNYNDVQKNGRKARDERQKAWYCELLLDRLEKLMPVDSAAVRDKNPKFHKQVLSRFKSWAKAMDELKKREEVKG